MNEVVRFLTSLAQALAKMSLYAEGHPARARASDAAFDQLRRLRESDPWPTFTFLADEVIYANRAVRELQEWDWARKLSSAGVQRIEFQADVGPEEFRAFLEAVLLRLTVHANTGNVPGTPRPGPDIAPIRFGAIGVRGTSVSKTTDGMPDPEPYGEDSGFDLTEEAEAVEWMHGEVLSAHAIPLVEAEAIVHSLSAAMHGGHQMFMPLLTLKDFDQYTTTHALNVAVLAMSLAEHLGLSARESRMYGLSGLLHDLGKVQMPLEILRKPGPLDPEELKAMQKHPVDGARMILQSDRDLDLCAVVAFEHHIMIDGRGYPARKRRCDCHHASRLVHVCDVFDALRTHRPYRVAWEPAAIFEYIGSRCGTEFDADVAHAFLEMVQARELALARARSIDGEVEAAFNPPGAPGAAEAF